MRCPNCGEEFERGRCPNCGRPASSSGSRVAAIVILIFLVIPAALFGACSIYATASVATAPGSDHPLGGLFALMAAVGVAVFLGGLALVVKLWKG